MTDRARVGLGVASTGYVVGVGVVAAWGFLIASPGPIIAAAVATLPASAISVPGYYVAYGLLSQIPGANPSHSTGSGSCAPGGVCHFSTTGDPAAWFSATTEVAGTLALVQAAVLNILALRLLLALLGKSRRHTRIPGGVSQG